VGKKVAAAAKGKLIAALGQRRFQIANKISTITDPNTLFLRKQEPFQLFSANTGGFYSENASKITD
jgi:hypothetical protein